MLWFFLSNFDNKQSSFFNLTRITHSGVEAWAASPITVVVEAPVLRLQRPPSTCYQPEVRKKSWSNCLEDFCCKYDIHSDWYDFKGKGFWYVLFLLLMYLIVFVIVVAVLVVAGTCYILCKFCESSESTSREQRPSSGGTVCIPIPLFEE